VTLASVAPILLQLAQTWAGGEIRQKAHQTIATTIYFAIAIVLGMTFGVAAIGCLLAALWFAVLPHSGPAGAFLIVAGVLVLMSLIVAMIPRLVRAPPAPRAEPDVSTQALLTDASRLMSDNKGAALLAALLVGLCEGTRKK